MKKNYREELNQHEQDRHDLERDFTLFVKFGLPLLLIALVLFIVIISTLIP